MAMHTMINMYRERDGKILNFQLTGTIFSCLSFLIKIKTKNNAEIQHLKGK